MSFYLGGVYLNSSSTKFLFEIIDKMEEYFIQGGDVSVNWYYVEDDEDIKEAGLEFKASPYTQVLD